METLSLAPSPQGVPVNTRRTWQEILVLLFARYEEMCRTQHEQLASRVGEGLAKRAANLSRHAIEYMDELSEDKANRWLGFVQGVLTVGDLIQVDSERDFTRPLFHELKGASPSHEVSER